MLPQLHLNIDLRRGNTLSKCARVQRRLSGTNERWSSGVLQAAPTAAVKTMKIEITKEFIARGASLSRVVENELRLPE